MSTRPSGFWNFNLFDFFVGVISGLFAIGVFYSLYPVYVQSQIPDVDGLVLLLGILILSYVVGRLVQALARGIESILLGGQRKPFENELEDANGNQVYSLFLEKSQDFFDFELRDGEYERDKDLEGLFMMTRAYLTNSGISPRVERFHASYLLFLNLSFIFIVGAGAHLVELGLAVCGYVVLSVSTGSKALLAVLLVAASVLSYHQRVWYHDRMVKVMIYDFYADVVGSPDHINQFETGDKPGDGRDEEE